MLLKGLKVIDWAGWIAGPGCAGLMADWGAEVIKVETFAGDPIRSAHHDAASGDPAGPGFTLDNRGKRGVALDLATPAGHRAMLALLEGADVLITNFRPGGLKRLGLDYGSIRERYPKLIYASVSAFGLVGDEIDKAGFDITVFWGRSGVGASTIPPNQEPFPNRPGFGDHMTALATLAGVLAALHERSRTGVGRLVEVSLMRAAAYALGCDLSAHLRHGATQTAVPRDQRPVANSGYFRTADDRWVGLVPRGPADFPLLMDALGLPQLGGDPRYQPPVTDPESVQLLRTAIDAAFAKLTLEEIRERLDAADLAWAPLATLTEFEMDPQAHAAGCFVEQPNGHGGSFWAPAGPVRFPGLDTGPAGPAPRLGEHSAEVLREAGLSEAEIAEAIGAAIG